MLQVMVRNAAGQAFMDMAGEFSARVHEIAAMPLANNFRRAILPLSKGEGKIIPPPSCARRSANSTAK